MTPKSLMNQPFAGRSRWPSPSSSWSSPMSTCGRTWRTGRTSAHVPEVMYGIPAWLWFNLAALVVTVGVAVLILRHMRRPLAVVPTSRLGQGQGLYLLLLAIMVIGNFEKALVSFAPVRLVTEGVIHCTALLCAVILLTSDSPRPMRDDVQNAWSAQALGLGAARVHRFDRGLDFDLRRLGNRQGRLWRSVCRARWAEHPVRTERDDSTLPLRTAGMNVGCWGGLSNVLSYGKELLQIAG